MPYIGNTPAEKYAAFNVQHFTTSATTSYTLTHAVANELDIRLVLNNVIQQPGSGKAYTAAATTLTLSSATTSSDTMYAVYIGKAVQTVTPPDGSVSESKLQVSNSPSNGQVLSAQSGATGGLTWAADAAGTITAFTNGVDDRVVTATSATALNGEANLTFAANVLAMIVSIDTASILRMSGNRGLAGESLGSVEYQWNGTPVCKITGTSGSDTTNKDDGNLSFYTTKSGESITERMRINKDGIVGIGAVLDGDLGVGLHIKTADSGASVNSNFDELVVEGSGNSGMSILSGASSEGAIFFGDSGSNAVGRLEYSHANNSMAVTTNGATAMIISSDGNVQIGTTANDGRVSIVSATGSEDILFCESGKASGYTNNLLKLGSGQNTTDGSFNIILGRNGGAETFKVLDSGNVLNTNNSYGAISDERIKQNITDASSQWNDIKALKVRNFKLKYDPTKTQLGVVAQDLETANMNGLVEEVKPNKEVVAYHSDFGTVVEGTADNGATPIKDDDGNITGYEDVFTEGQKVKSVKYSVLYMKAIKALQESMERIETLETANTDLTTRLEALENA